MLFWVVFFLVFLGPFIIPWWISLHGSGRWFFTALNPGTGAIRVLNGRLVEMSYVNKNGVAKIGHITEGGTYDGVILPRGYCLIPCIETDLIGKKEIQRNDDNSNDSLYLSILRHYGIYYVGFPPAQRSWYRFAFSEFSRAKGKEGEVVRREEPTNFFYLARVEYALKAKDVEIGGNAIVNLHFSVFIRIVIPEIAFAENVDVIGQLNTILHTEATTFFRPITYELLKDRTNEERFRDLITGINGINTKKTLGVIIEEVRLNEVSGELPVTLKGAFQAKLVAEKEGDAAIVKATKEGEAKIALAQAGVTVAAKEAEAKNIRTDAERRRIKETYEEVEKHANGVDLRRLEAMAEAGAGGNTIVFEGDGSMSKDAKKMLVVTDRLRPKDTSKKEGV